VHRFGKYVLVTQNDVDRAERFLVGRGAWALPVARMLPFVRAFASIVAGIVDVPPVRFGILNLIGTLVYVVALSSIGYSLGGEWQKFNKTFSDASYVLVGLVVIGIVAYVIYRLREFRKESAYAAKHGGTSQVGTDKQRSGRLYSHRARRGRARGHRHPGSDQRGLRRRPAWPSERQLPKPDGKPAGRDRRYRAAAATNPVGKRRPRAAASEHQRASTSRGEQPRRKTEAARRSERQRARTCAGPASRGVPKRSERTPQAKPDGQTSTREL
jgi:hypothetical protein